MHIKKKKYLLHYPDALINLNFPTIFLTLIVKKKKKKLNYLGKYVCEVIFLKIPLNNNNKRNLTLNLEKYTTEVHT